jgi:hypothetical protein
MGKKRLRDTDLGDPGDSPAFHLIYRTYSGENLKGRPEWYSKAKCFQSLVVAARACSSLKSLTVLCDSTDLPRGVSECLSALDPVQFAVQVRFFNGVGNSGSLRRAIEMSRNFPAQDLVYLSEDDYLFRRDALALLVEVATQNRDIDYFSLYDHPDRYRRSDDVARSYRRPIVLSDGYFWRECESTCMSFAARAGTIRSDQLFLRAFLRIFPSIPHDRTMWRTLQSPLLLRRRRSLFSALPGLATHCEEDMLSPTIDWAKEAVGLIGDGADRLG